MDDQIKTPQPLKKLTTQIEETNDLNALELIGKDLVLEEISTLNDISAEQYRDKVPSILIGLPPEFFANLLAMSHNVSALKTIALTEPLQHHLTTLSHDLANQIIQIQLELDNLYAEISTLDTAPLDNQDIKNIHDRIDALSKKLEQITHLTSKALSIAWNTSRVDLIEEYSHTKERAEILIARGIGFKGENEGPTGIYAALEERLFSVFAKDNMFGGAKDDEPAVEALSQLSIWYPKDYRELGLLPQFTNVEEIDLQGLETRTHTLQVISQNLKSLGLETLKDLRRARIFSRKTLQEYIYKSRAKADLN